MNLEKILKFISRQKVAVLGSVDELGYPNQKAMLAPRKIERQMVFYFSTNTCSIRVRQYRINPKASLYFFHKGLIRYEGVMFTGEIEILEDYAIKKALWQRGDRIFYKQGITDPDYCILKFTAISGRYYCDLKSESFSCQE